jgi:hypothetical protein
MTIAYFSVVSWGAEFIYPAVILKAFSRRVVGCAGRTLEAQLTVAALRMALIEKQPVRASLHNAGLSEVASEVREKQNPALLGYLEPHPATITKSANAATVAAHIRGVAEFAKHFSKSPNLLGPEFSHSVQSVTSESPCGLVRPIEM